MDRRIEDYAMIGDCRTGALISRDGSIDWLCLPRFDSDAVFAALLGTEDNGRWQIAPACEVQRIRRQYVGDTVVLETVFETEEGDVALIDFMPLGSEKPQLVRIVEGRTGRVPMKTSVAFRFDYGSVIPWVRRVDHRRCAAAGSNSLYLSTDAPIHGKDWTTVGEFAVGEGESVEFVLAWALSYEDAPKPVRPDKALKDTKARWQDWVSNITYDGPWRSAVVRSLLTLKGLTFAPSGGLLAALTTSLPESPGGSRNWDYRFCWLRDATFTLYTFLVNGCKEEAAAWRNWLHRAVAGNPSQIQPVYSLEGDRRLNEYQLPWLPGFNGASPVRVGNAAADQFQLDVFGEIMDVFHVARRSGLEPDENMWQVLLVMLEHLENVWQDPDQGIWELRGDLRHVTHSKVMAWVAFDRAVKAVERFSLEGPVEKWRALREYIHKQICERGFDPALNSFVQSYGSREVDASLLMLPMVGFLPPDDPRILGTIETIQQELSHSGLVARYRVESGVDGMEGDEGAFLLCSFWMVDALALAGRQKEAGELFERLLALRNDVGLLSEEYDAHRGCMLGNFPQAFSHVAMVNSALNLEDRRSPTRERSENESPSGGKRKSQKK
ncbi:MAG: glycoside hydrolase family 15 protein [Phycisphaerae bacterium]|nr:glycoside hydrolase family 15 protein [Phycisphaerae bacterium]